MSTSKLSNKKTLVIEWVEKSHSKNSISLTKYVELKDRLIKKSYLKFIYSIHRKKVKDKSVENYFINNHDFILYYMTLVFEKNLYKSKHIQDCLKLIALNDLIKKNRTKFFTIRDVPQNCCKSVINLMRYQELNIKF